MNKIDDSTTVSDSWLRAFLAAARFENFSIAAEHLGVGQPAVSHAVARLERAARIALFVRSRAGVRLTESGRALYEGVRRPFEEIDHAVAELHTRTDEPTVTLSVSTSFATFWLMPRLNGFKRAHPDVRLRVITTDSDRMVGLDDGDLWIPLGQVSSAGLRATPFCEERVVPVASPELARSLVRKDHRKPQRLLRALATAPRIDLEERYAPRVDWARWYEDQGEPAPTTAPAYRSNDYSLVLQAAIEGVGVALGWMHIVSDLIARGSLQPIGPTLKTDASFSILERSDRPSKDAAAALRNWLTATSASSSG